VFSRLETGRAPDPYPAVAGLVLRLDLVPLANSFQQLLKNGTLVIDARWTTFLAGSHCLVRANLICGDLAQLCFRKRPAERQ